MNSVSLIGNVTKDLELKTSSSGVDYVNFSIGVSRMKQRDKADFINITAFGKTAEVCAKYLSKGSRVGVTGSLQTDSYQGKDGNTRYTTQVIAQTVDFLNAKSEGKSAQPDDLEDFTPPAGTELPF